MVNNKPVVILGAGENGRVVKNILLINGRKQIMFLDDAKNSKDVIGTLNDINNFNNDYDFFVSFGKNMIRKIWYERLIKMKKKMVCAIHPKAYLETSVRMGKNVMLGAFTYININAVIGDNVIINNNCIIEHDNIIEDHVQIAPGVIIGGKVLIKQNSFLGIGSVIIDHLTVERNNVIGAGSVVVENTEKDGLYLGIPAKKFKDLGTA